MCSVTVLKPIKQIHDRDVALIKIGGFYHAYGRDSYILSYLFGYRLKKFEKDCTLGTSGCLKINLKNCANVSR